MPYSKEKHATCLVCGRKVWRQFHQKAKFLCSRECLLARRRLLERRSVDPVYSRNCSFCGKKFTPHVFARNKAKFCSRRCNRQDYRRRAYRKRRDFFAQKNRRWREKHKWNGNWYKGLTRDNFTCQLCGARGDQNSLKDRFILVHHLDGEGETGSNNHELSNLLTTCYDCHEGLHGISLVKIDGRWYFKGKILQRFDTDNISIWKD